MSRRHYIRHMAEPLSELDTSKKPLTMLSSGTNVRVQTLELLWRSTGSVVAFSQKLTEMLL